MCFVEMPHCKKLSINWSTQTSLPSLMHQPTLCLKAYAEWFFFGLFCFVLFFELK